MIKKICFKCGVEQELFDNFYKHPEMADGHLSKCKTCTKKDVSGNYRKNIDHYVDYEVNRESSENRKAKKIEYQRNYRARNNLKYKARSAVSNAIRDGRLKREPCAKCGNPNTHAHHNDYSKPLDVDWICPCTHNKLHNKMTHRSEPCQMKTNHEQTKPKSLKF